MTDFQPRYRRAPGNEKQDDPEYLLFEDLTYEDIKFNIDRLRREAAADMKHAGSLEAYKNRNVPRHDVPYTE